MHKVAALEAQAAEAEAQASMPKSPPSIVKHVGCTFQQNQFVDAFTQMIELMAKTKGFEPTEACKLVCAATAQARSTPPTSAVGPITADLLTSQQAMQSQIFKF